MHYLNRGHGVLVCKKDKYVQCSINGLNKVLLEKWTHKLMVIMCTKGIVIETSKQLYSIWKLPKYDANKCHTKNLTNETQEKNTLAKSWLLSKQMLYAVMATEPKKCL